MKTTVKTQAETLCAMNTNAESPRPARRRTRGQSLVEFALSAALMILLISGIVDLGRAYFALIALDSVISEGAHWAAAYPGCVPTASDTLAGPPECQGTNSVVGRMLNENANLDLSKMVTVSVMPEDVNAWINHWSGGAPDKGQTIIFSVAYRVDAMMPLTQLLAGNALTITAQAKEVVRGVGLPEYDGAPTPQGGVEFVATPPPPSNVRQQSTALGGVCSAGYAKLMWDVQVATGYRVYAEDGATLITEVTPGTTTEAMVDVGVGATRVFNVSAFSNNGLHEAESEKVAITVTCSDVHPDNLTMTCSATGATAYWTPSPTDAAVAGYALERLSAPATVRAAWNGALRASGSFSFASSQDSPARYRIRARTSSGALFGAPSNEFQLTCDVSIGALPAPVPNFRRVSSTCNNGQMTLTWDRLAGVHGYEIRTGADFETGSSVAVVNGDFPVPTVVNVGSGSGRTYHIRAFLNGEGGRTYGLPSAGLSVSCPVLKAPWLSATCGVLGSSATFTWGLVNDSAVTGYQLWRRTGTGVLRSTTLYSPTNTYDLTFQTGDNNASYEIRLVDALGNPIGTPSSARSVNCTPPPPIQNFGYVANSCTKLSNTNNRYRLEWTPYTISGVPLTFRVWNTTQDREVPFDTLEQESGYTRVYANMAKQREGDTFTVTAIQASTQFPIPSTTSAPFTLPRIGNACR
ncbi:MAG: pilus assembly protein [Anaerolineae bacterium]|nr:pilus assembly protein [Anaerolineae bacterium]